jgi:hypothetical protein
MVNGNVRPPPPPPLAAIVIVEPDGVTVTLEPAAILRAPINELRDETPLPPPPLHAACPTTPALSDRQSPLVPPKTGVTPSITTVGLVEL